MYVSTRDTGNSRGQWPRSLSATYHSPLAVHWVACFACSAAARVEWACVCVFFTFSVDTIHPAFIPSRLLLCCSASVPPREQSSLGTIGKCFSILVEGPPFSFYCYKIFSSADLPLGYLMVETKISFLETDISRFLFVTWNITFKLNYDALKTWWWCDSLDYFASFNQMESEQIVMEQALLLMRSDTRENLDFSGKSVVIITFGKWQVGLEEMSFFRSFVPPFQCVH